MRQAIIALMIGLTTMCIAGELNVSLSLENGRKKIDFGEKSALGVYRILDPEGGPY